MMNSVKVRSTEKRRFEETSLLVGGQSLARALDFRDIKTPNQPSFLATQEEPDSHSKVQEQYNKRLLRSLEKKARNRLGKEDDGQRATQQLKELSALFRRQPLQRTPCHPASAHLLN